MSAIFPPVILGPEMAVPMLWAPGILWFFLQEKTLHPIKFLTLGGVFWDLGGGGKCHFFFFGRGGLFSGSSESVQVRTYLHDTPQNQNKHVQISAPTHWSVSSEQ